MMNESEKREYQERMFVAHVFRAFVTQTGQRKELVERYGKMPAIIPALEDTLAAGVQNAAERYFSEGDECVLVPVHIKGGGSSDFKIKVLLITKEESPTFWKLSSDELHASTRMWQIVEALDPYKEWDLSELALEQQGQVLGRSGLNL